MKSVKSNWIDTNKWLCKNGGAWKKLDVWKFESTYETWAAKSSDITPDTFDPSGLTSHESCFPSPDWCVNPRNVQFVLYLQFADVEWGQKTFKLFTSLFQSHGLCCWVGSFDCTVRCLMANMRDVVFFEKFNFSLVLPEMIRCWWEGRSSVFSPVR